MTLLSTLLLPLMLSTTLLAACASSPPSPPALAQPPSVRQLGWLSGRWHTTAGTTYLEETWSAPEGDSMLGMFRAVKDGTAGFYELMAIEQDSDGIVLRMLHFGPKFTPHEGDGDLMRYVLVETDETQYAIFETPTEDRVRRIVYRLQGRTLHISLLSREGAVLEQFILSR
ncbi:DUF6265 family protein [Stigmatella sp. ncwal1]|uniref:DUF6265 family protein n=1 Tax=Stigmatella ashevillensis TaxID=2995309 RepID=A0ABT5D4Y4_9BACT|nr:DUF6265 family protein [Stigmatella ashevillena]MDC0708724.1 DUF6265 family protein [Stigmatella ashevillena]